MAGKVLILMGSKADAEVMGEAARVLSGFGIPYTLTVASAHRSPARTRKIASQAEGEGGWVIIARAAPAPGPPPPPGRRSGSAGARWARRSRPRPKRSDDRSFPGVLSLFLSAGGPGGPRARRLRIGAEGSGRPRGGHSFRCSGQGGPGGNRPMPAAEG